MSTVTSLAPAVSTDGLGSTGASVNSVMTNREVAVRPQFTRPRQSLQFSPTFTDIKCGVSVLVFIQKSVKGSAVDGGEGDILEQWRRRRKVDEMRSRVDCGETASKSAATVVSDTSVSEHIEKC